MDFQLNLANMEDTEFEEKVNIDDLFLPSEPARSAEIDVNDIKQEPLEEAAFESDPDKEKMFKLKMEENILELYMELDNEKSEKSTMDFSLTRSLKIRQFVEKIAHKDSLVRYHEVKAFSCKFCDQSFGKVHEVKEHVKTNDSIPEVKDLKDQVKSLKTQVEELEVKLKNSQKNEFKTKAKIQGKQKIPEPGVIVKFKKSKSKLAYQTRQKMKFEKDAKMGFKQETPEQGGDQEILNDNLELMNQSKEKNKNQPTGKMPCRICGAQFSSKYNVANHIQSVHDGKKFVCTHCNKDFAYKTSLKKHKKNVHDLLKYPCPQCDSQLACADSLKQHIASVHHKKRNFLCGFCKKTFFAKQQFQVHYKKYHN